MNLGLLAWMPGPLEWSAIAVVALLVFGRRLPDVARSVGKSIVEFKRGLRDVKDEIDVQSRLEPPANSTVDSGSDALADKPPVAPKSADEPTSASGPSKESTPASK